jgi:hypothetical protein
MVSRIVRVGILACIMAAAGFDTASAGTAYDGSWNLSIVTQRGACDPSYNFHVLVNNGIVSHPNLVRLRGRVSSGGLTRVSVSVMDKHASGSGKLSRNSGRGRWSGYSGADRCSGYWIAQRG